MIKIISKMFNIVEYLHYNRKITLKSLSARTGIAKPTLCNILKEMCSLGYVLNDGSGGYMLSEKFRDLGNGSHLDPLVGRLSMETCVRLANATRESAVITVLQDENVRIISQAQFPRSLVLNISVYSSLSLYHSVSGRVILSGLTPLELDALIDSGGLPSAMQWEEGCASREALKRELEKIRQKKLSLMVNEDEEIKSYAVPFSDLSGRTAGSLGLTVPLFRLCVETEKLIYGNLRECAQWLFEQNKKHGLAVENWRNYGN